MIAPIERRDDDGLGRGRLVDEAAADRLGHGRAGERADEVERRRHEDRLARVEGPRRDGRGDRVRRVVESVDVVEGDRQHDDDDEERA